METVSEPVKKSPKFSKEEKVILDLAKNRVKVLEKDPNQDNKSLSELLESKLNYLKRLEERTRARVEAEMPKDLTDAQRLVIREGARSYAREIEILEKLIKKVE